MGTNKKGLSSWHILPFFLIFVLIAFTTSESSASHQDLMTYVENELSQLESEVSILISLHELPKSIEDQLKASVTDIHVNIINAKISLEAQQLDAALFFLKMAKEDVSQLRINMNHWRKTFNLSFIAVKIEATLARLEEKLDDLINFIIQSMQPPLVKPLIKPSIKVIPVITIAPTQFKVIEKVHHENIFITSGLSELKIIDSHHLTITLSQFVKKITLVKSHHITINALQGFGSSVQLRSHHIEILN